MHLGWNCSAPFNPLCLTFACRTCIDLYFICRRLFIAISVTCVARKRYFKVWLIRTFLSGCLHYGAYEIPINRLKLKAIQVDSWITYNHNQCHTANFLVKTSDSQFIIAVSFYLLVEKHGRYCIVQSSCELHLPFNALSTKTARKLCPHIIEHIITHAFH